MLLAVVIMTMIVRITRFLMMRMRMHDFYI